MIGSAAATSSVCCSRQRQAAAHGGRALQRRCAACLSALQGVGNLCISGMNGVPLQGGRQSHGPPPAPAADVRSMCMFLCVACTYVACGRARRVPRCTFVCMPVGAAVQASGAGAAGALCHAQAGLSRVCIMCIWWISYLCLWVALVCVCACACVCVLLRCALCAAGG